MKKMVEVVRLERCHQCAVEQTDDFLLQHVAERTLEEVIDVRLIPQKCLQERSVQVDK